MWPVENWQQAHDQGLVSSPRAAFRDGQITGLSQADTQAIADGADIGQVVNAAQGMTTVELFGRKAKATLAGTTRRSAWRKAHPDIPIRLRPEQIYVEANGDRDEAKRLLNLHGFRDDGPEPTPAPPPAPDPVGGGSKLPPRRGMLGATGDDEFPSFDGYQPPFRRTQIVEFDDQDALAVLDDDGTPGDHGGHRHGSGRGKSEFPAGWDVDDVIEWVRAIVDHPTHAAPDPKRTGVFLYGVHRGVEGRVVLRNPGGSVWMIATAHPQPNVDWVRG